MSTQTQTLTRVGLTKKKRVQPKNDQPLAEVQPSKSQFKKRLAPSLNFILSIFKFDVIKHNFEPEEEIAEEFFDFRLAKKGVFIKRIKKESQESDLYECRHSQNLGAFSLDIHSKNLPRNELLNFINQKLSTSTGKKQQHLSELEGFDVFATFLVQKKSISLKDSNLHFTFSRTEFQDGDTHSSFSISSEIDENPQKRVEVFNKELENIPIVKNEVFRLRAARSKVLEFFFRYRKDVYDQLIVAGVIPKDVSYFSSTVCFERRHPNSIALKPSHDLQKEMAREQGLTKKEALKKSKEMLEQLSICEEKSYCSWLLSLLVSVLFFLRKSLKLVCCLSLLNFFFSSFNEKKK